MATDIRLKETLPAITDRVVETYAECSSIHHLDHVLCPTAKRSFGFSLTCQR